MARKTLFLTELTDYKDSDIEGVGNVREEANGDIYRWVKNLSATTALAAGQPVCFSVANAGSSLKKSVEYAPLTADLNLFAGVAVSAIPKAQYGWIKVRGVYNTTAIHLPKTTAWAAGDTLVCANTSAHFDRQAAQGTAPTYPNGGIILEAVATETAAAASTAKCMIYGIL